MKNSITIILSTILLFTTHVVNAQLCPPNTITTNPNVTGGFDWLFTPYQVYAPGYFNIDAPYYATNNPNLGLVSLLNDKDNKPEDGWELVYTWIGNSSVGVNNPAVILYNKYRSVLRVFVYLQNENYFKSH